MNTTRIPAPDEGLSFTMTHHNPRIISLHDSDGSMYIAERLIHTSQVNNAFLHGLELWGPKLTGLDALECFFLKQRGEKLDDPAMQKRLDAMDNFSFAVSQVVQKETARGAGTPPFGLVSVSFDCKWTVNGKPGECVFELEFVCISRKQFELRVQHVTTE